MSDHTEYFVVDEVERVVRAGPFRSADIAEELADRPNDIVATGDALDLVDGTPLRWETENGPDVVTGGGRP